MNSLLKFTFFLFLSAPFQSDSQVLNRYSCFSDQFTFKGWMSQYDRTFDTNGVLIQKKEYHALSIAFCGLLAYDEFERTKDSTYYYHVINQHQYFRDTSRIELFNNGTEMALPYHFNFHDLKAPWYSGMTQGTAISYLLRYYKLTGDEEALTQVKQLAKFMLKDISEGGTIGCTPENYLIIEEYPNSKSQRNVLNGFINGLIGLHEYLQFFPEDEHAKEVHNDCYVGLFKALEHYDKPNWTNYNRNGKHITNQYMRYQLTEFDHLFDLYQDQRFIHQMMIWGSYSYNKFDNELKFYRNKNYNYAIPLIDSLNSGKYTPTQVVYPSISKIVIENRQENQNHLSKERPLFISSLDPINELQLQYSGIPKIKKIKIEGLNKKMYNSEIDFSNKIITVKLTDTTLIKPVILYSMREKKELIIRDCKAFFKSKYDRPLFAYYLHKQIVKVKADTEYEVVVNSINTPGLIFFYKFSETEAELKKQKFIHYKQLGLKDNLFSKNGFIEIMACYNINSNPSLIDKFQLLESLKE